MIWVWIASALALFIVQIGAVLVIEFRHPNKTVAWLVILLLFPFIGFILWYFLAKEYTRRRTVRRKWRGELLEFRRDLNRTADPAGQGTEAGLVGIYGEHRLLGLLNHIPASPITRRNKTQVLTNAPATYASMLEALERAKDHIHMEFYTIRDDHIGREFHRLLLRKVREGVKVRLLYDGIGSYKLSDAYVRELEEAGVETGCFLPPLFAFVEKRLNYRNHRKIIVVDGFVGFMGGLNIGDEYLGGNPRLGFWRDTHFRFEGDAVFYLQKSFLNDWRFVKGEEISDSRYYPEHDCEGSGHVQIVTSGPDAHWDTIVEVFFSAINAAKHRVYIASPYFIPDASVMMALKTAALSGIDVRVLFPSVPDTKIVHWASLSYMEELMQAGVKFYSYQKGFIHCKVMLVDRLLAFAGTANCDMRSFYSNFEMNAVLFDRSTISRLEKDYLQDLRDSREVRLAEFCRRGKAQRAREVLARLLSPLF